MNNGATLKSTALFTRVSDYAITFKLLVYFIWWCAVQRVLHLAMQGKDINLRRGGGGGVGGGGYQHLTNVKIISIMCSSLGNLWASLSLYQLFITTRSTRKTFTIYISVMIFETTWLRLLSIALIASSISGEWMQNRQSVPSALWSLSRSDSTLVNTGSFCASFSYASHSVCDDRRLFSTLAFIFS